MSVVNDVTRFVDGCVQVVECFYNFHFDRDALDFSRFTVHLRFFAQRVFQGKQEQENDTHDEMFRALIARNCSEHYKCACCIAEYVRNTWHKELSDEELVFLTIHLSAMGSIKLRPTRCSTPKILSFIFSSPFLKFVSSSSEHYKCACYIAEYVRNTWHKELSDEELVFLTIHLKRIRMGK